MSGQPYRLICLVARPCGVNLLAHLLKQPDLQVARVFTHYRRPRSEDPARSERPEFSQIRQLLNGTGIPLSVVDGASGAERMEGFPAAGEFDFLLSLSWRYLVRSQFLGRSRLADINLHRGLLPRYGGAEPVRRMLEDGLTQATITAHLMVEKIDAGEILQEDHLPMQVLAGETVPDAVARIKHELDPIYPFTAVKAMNQVLRRKGLPEIRT